MSFLPVFLQTLPFFALIGLGYGAGRGGLFPQEATAWLTRFVFYFALSAMLFRFAATLPVAELMDPRFILAYLGGTLAVYLLAMAVALARRTGVPTAAVEAQCAVIGNTGFLGVPLFVALIGPQAAGPVLMMLTVDLVVFSSLIVILVTGARDGRFRLAILGTVGMGLVKNPMIVSISAGLAWSLLGWPIPRPMADFLTILGAAATPGALFAIGASLAGKSAERLSVALWLSFAKLALHPAAVGVMALFVLPVDPFAAGVMIAAAALPVAGNVYILAMHFGVAPQRVSAAILISTAVSVVTVTLAIAWLRGGIGLLPG
jgi:malonate transporter and related proteins